MYKCICAILLTVFDFSTYVVNKNLIIIKPLVQTEPALVSAGPWQGMDAIATASASL